MLIFNTLKPLLIILPMFMIFISSCNVPSASPYPKPTGAFSVGTRKHVWQQRTGGTSEVIAISAQIWYPGVIDGTKQEKYLVGPEAIAIAENYVKAESEFALTVMHKSANALRSNSYLDINLVDTPEKLPVIIFSHGFRANRVAYISLCENLASHGYVVIAIDHPSICVSSTYEIPETDDYSGRPVWLQECLKNIAFTLHKVTELNCEDVVFRNKLDLEKIGMFGHSNGGMISMGACKAYDQIKAGIAIDGPILDVFEEGMDKPFMLMLAGSFSEMFSENFFASKTRPQTLCKNTQLKGNCAYKLTLPEASHCDFCDLFVLDEIASSIPGISIDLEQGRIPASRLLRITNEYIVAFFDKHLMGQNAELLASSDSPYIEATFEAFLN